MMTHTYCQLSCAVDSQLASLSLLHSNLEPHAVQSAYQNQVKLIILFYTLPSTTHPLNFSNWLSSVYIYTRSCHCFMKMTTQNQRGSSSLIYHVVCWEIGVRIKTTQAQISCGIFPIFIHVMEIWKSSNLFNT